MRIRELEIDRFGVWRDVTLPLNPNGVTVFYGPNEAGKSTLMRFIRGVLYGYQSRDERTPGPNPQPFACSGTLRIDHGGRELRLRRVTETGSRGRIELDGRRIADDDPFLTQLVGGASEPLFQNVFAIGLHELQQLATLNGEEVAEHIYGLSLGPDGQRILRAQSSLLGERQRLLGEDHRSGEIHDLLKQLEAIERDIARAGAPTDQHGEIIARQQSLEKKIEGHKREQAGLKQTLRGHQFLQRAWTPWSRERELRRQLDRLPKFDIPPEVLGRFDELELEIEEVQGTRRRILEDVRRLKKQADDIQIRPEIEEHSCRVLNLFEQREKMLALEKRIQEGPRQKFAPVQVPELQPLLARISGNWTVDRLQRLEMSPKSLQSLLKSADEYKLATRRRGRLVKLYKRRTAQLQKLQRELESQTKLMGGLSPQEFKSQCRKRIEELERLAELATRRDQLHRASQLLSGPIAQRVIGHELPPFFSTVLWFFSVGGLIMFGCGLYAFLNGYAQIVRGDWTSLLVGIIYSLMGISALALRYTMTQHFSSQEVRLVGSGDEQARLQQEITSIEEEIDRLTRRDALKLPLSGSAPRHGDVTPVSERLLLADLRKQIADIDGLESLSNKVERMRRTLSVMRQRLQETQRNVSRCRREWNDLLRAQGLPESLKTDPAIQTFAQLMEAKTVWQQHQLAGSNHVDRDKEDLAEFRKQVESLGIMLHGPNSRIYDHYRALAEWQQEVQAIAERRRQRSQLRKSAKDKHTEAERHGERLKRLQTQRTELLARLGVLNRDEITQRLQTLEQRSHLERQVQEIRSELVRLSESEPELAIVDDHFRDFDETTNLQAITTTNRKLEGLDASLRAAYEELGTLRQNLREVEDDRKLTSLRFDRAQINAALKEATHRWCAARLADHVVGSLRDRIEKTRQPKTLQRASVYLRKLTCERYRNIWTQLGDRVLVIDDDQGQSLRVEQLSSGTREQVFLAIRLAMIDGLAEDGMELPLVLDDVTVNFDQTRTEAAVGTLLDVAGDGQQILLFTCHQHLARIFEQEGVEPVQLPSHEGSLVV